MFAFFVAVSVPFVVEVRSVVQNSYPEFRNEDNPGRGSGVSLTRGEVFQQDGQGPVKPEVIV